MYPHTFALELTQSSDYISFCPFACLSKALSGLIPIHGCVWATEIITSSESNVKPVIYLSIFLYIITPVLLVLTSSLFEQSSSSLTNYLRWLSSRSYKSDWLHPAIFKRTSVHIVGKCFMFYLKLFKWCCALYPLPTWILKRCVNRSPYVIYNFKVQIRWLRPIF